MVSMHGDPGEKFSVGLRTTRIVVLLAALMSVATLTTCSLFGPNEVPLDLSASTVPLEIQFQHSAETPAASAGTGGLGPRAVGAELSLYLGFKGTQSGCLVAGDSTRDDVTMSFGLSAIADDGETLLGWPDQDGGTVTPEEFVLPDPSVLQGPVGDGETVWSWPGMFLARFSPLQPTDLIATPNVDESDPLSAHLTEVDEVVMRAALIGEPVNDQNGDQISGTLVITSPHFVVDTGDGPTAYHDRNVSLSINGETGVLSNFEYVFFVPASIVGQGFNYLVHGDNTVFNPVLGDEMDGDPEGSSWFVNAPSTWTLNPDWISNAEANAGLFEMIDAIAGVSDPAERMGNGQWVEVAEYFQGFFAKYYRAMCTMFNVGNGLGNGGNSSFQLIALDDSNGPLLLADNAVLGVTYTPENATFTLVDNVLEIAGSPPLEFQTEVIYAE